MRFDSSDILQFFIMSSYCALRAQCYYTQRSSYTEANSKPTVLPDYLHLITISWKMEMSGVM